MRKNILVATLVGLCVIGLSGCSKGEDKAENAPTTAMNATTQESPATTTPGDQAQAAQPETSQIADNSSVTTQATAPAAPNANAADATASTTNSSSTTTTGTDIQGQPTQTTDATSTTTTAPADTTTTATPATDTTTTTTTTK